MPKSNQALDVLPLKEPATRFWELPDKLSWVCWAPPTHGHKAGGELQHCGYLQRAEVDPGGDLGWKARICRVCSQCAEMIARLRPARGAFTPASS